MTIISLISLIAGLIAGGFAVPGWLLAGVATVRTARCRFMACGAWTVAMAGTCLVNWAHHSWVWLAVSGVAWVWAQSRTSHWWQRWKLAERLTGRGARLPLPQDFDR